MCGQSVKGHGPGRKLLPRSAGSPGVFESSRARETKPHEAQGEPAEILQRCNCWPSRVQCSKTNTSKCSTSKIHNECKIHNRYKKETNTSKSQLLQNPRIDTHEESAPKDRKTATIDIINIFSDLKNIMRTERHDIFKRHK